MKPHDVSRYVFHGARYVMLAMGLAACSAGDRATGPGGTGVGTGDSYIRYVNGAYREVSVSPATATVYVSGETVITTTTTTATYESVPVDFLLDSSLVTPSALGLAPGTRSTGTVGQIPANLTSAGYMPVPRGIHSFVARVNGLTPGGPSFFTTDATSGIQEYLPKQYMVASAYYTLGIAGIIAGTTDDGEQKINPPANILFNLSPDDRFPAPSTVVNGKDVLQARFQVYNFATWASSYDEAAGLRIYLTPGDMPPTKPLDDLVATGTALSYKDLNSFRRYVNALPGTYYLSIVTSTYPSVPVLGKVVTFKSGEVHTLFVVNDMSTFSAQRIVTTYADESGVYAQYVSVQAVTPPTFKVIDVVDNQY